MNGESELRENSNSVAIWWACFGFLCNVLTLVFSLKCHWWNKTKQIQLKRRQNRVCIFQAIKREREREGDIVAQAKPSVNLEF